MPETNVKEAKVSTYTLLLIFAVACIAGGVYLYLRFTGSSGSTPQAQDSLKELSSLIDAGSYTQASKMAQDVAEHSSDLGTRLTAERLGANGLFMTGDTQKQIEAVQSMKLVFAKDALTSDKQRQAKDINMILRAVTVSRDKQVFAEAFSGPFAQYKVEGDFSVSMANLAKYSYSLYPTALAVFTSSFPDISPLVDFDKTYNLSDAEKKNHADAIIGLTKRAEELASRENASGASNALDPATFYYWEGILYGAVATVYPDYLKKSESAFQKIFDYYDSTKDASGQPLAIIESRLPMAHFMWASTLYRVAGEKRQADVEKHLSSIVALVHKNPSNFENQFLPLIQRTAAGTAVSQGTSFIALGRLYKPFGDFLAEYGLNVR